MPFLSDGDREPLVNNEISMPLLKTELPGLTIPLINLLVQNLFSKSQNYYYLLKAIILVK